MVVRRVVYDLESGEQLDDQKDFANAPNKGVFAKLPGAPRNIRIEFHYSSWPDQPQGDGGEKSAKTSQGPSASRAGGQDSNGPSAVAGPVEVAIDASCVPCLSAGSKFLEESCRVELEKLVQSVPFERRSVRRPAQGFAAQSP